VFLSTNATLTVRLKDLFGKKKKYNNSGFHLTKSSKQETEPTRRKPSKFAENECRNRSNFVSFILTHGIGNDLLMHFRDSNHEVIRMYQEKKQRHQGSKINFMLMRIETAIRRFRFR